ncbi:MAG TPA: nitrilase-related carbon-nitrogen hydrolase [Armatimonadota bacterium]|jgi:predicted amidohydrolase
MKPIRVAALSPSFKPGETEYNLERARAGLQAAHAADVELALFSEWYLTNSVSEDAYRTAEPVPAGPAARQTIDMAKEFNITVAMGIEELDPATGVVYNTHFLAGPDGFIGKHRKTHLMVREWQFHRPGSELRTFDIGKANVGINICHETMYPENSRVLALQGMEILLAPFGCGGSPQCVAQADWLNDFHMACWRARAFDNGVFVIISGGNGTPGHQSRSYACVIDPNANVLSPITPEPDIEGLNMIVADLDPERFIARRTDANYPIKKRRPELYGRLVEPY